MKTTEPTMTQAEALLDSRLWLTVEEAASLIGITPEAAYQRIYRGTLPTQMFGKSHRVAAAFVRTLDPTASNDRGNS